MGPSARHLDAERFARRLDLLPYPFRVTASVEISVFRRLSQ